MKKSLVSLVLVFAAGMLYAQGAPQSAPPAAGQAAAGQAAPQQKTIKDPAEYNAYVTALNQTDPAAKAQALETFLQQYPNSVVKVDALELLMATYQQVGNSAKVLETANRVLQADPNNLRALALLTYISRQQAEQGGPNAAQNLQQAAQYAQRGMQSIQTAAKPAEVTAADWEKLKTQTSVIFEGALGLAALQQKDYANAARYLSTAVQAQPNDLRNVYPLALAYLQQKPQDVRGLWYIARAVNLAAGTPAEAQIAAYGKRAYTSYHGGPDGWEQLVAQAKTAPAPPAGFAVAPAPTPAEMATKIVQTKTVANMSFDEIQLVLTSGNQQAATTIWNQLKGKALKIEGKLISGDPAKLMIAGSADDIEANRPDIELIMAEKIPAKIMPKNGQMTPFQGTLVSYDVNPFLVHMNEGFLLDKKGNPLQVPKAAPAKRPARRRPPR